MYSSPAVTDNQLPISDTQEWQALAKRVGWDTDYYQVEAGALDGSFKFSVTANLRIGSPYTNKSIMIRGVPPADCCALLIPLTATDNGLFQGQTIGRGQAAIMCPGRESCYRTSTPNRFISVSIPVSRLRSVVEQSTEHSLEPLLMENRIVPMEPQALPQLQQWLQQVIAFSAGTGPATHSASRLAEIEQHIVGALTMALTEHPDDAPRRVTQRHQVFLHARDYIENHLEAPLGLEAIARETRVSLRTLRYSFQQMVGLNPLQYIKLRRLSAVRRSLLEGDPAELSVTAAAMRCGFSHMSYFARDYRRLFGEFPAQTLSKSSPRI